MYMLYLCSFEKKSYMLIRERIILAEIICTVSNEFILRR